MGLKEFDCEVGGLLLLRITVLQSVKGRFNMSKFQSVDSVIEILGLLYNGSHYIPEGNLRDFNFSVLLCEYLCKSFLFTQKFNYACVIAFEVILVKSLLLR
jgi:hypothetical protein